MAEEFRLRAGQPLAVLLPEGERSLGAAVTPEDLETLCDLATDYSRYAAEETLREGYLSVRGGFRVGLCGTAVMKDGESTALRDLSSAAVRIAREQRGIIMRGRGNSYPPHGRHINDAFPGLWPLRFRRPPLIRQQ